ncbi:heme/hemin ABC transporter substrate-binding protein [Loktanella sp. S4079]|uniref:heme/hemin ABC transporter substrate-binding protein n=1 Tax=Loktanella sp. S4079 TaxID=579483 RepID=UPI0005F9DBBD|nr:ABC transporter substrate-binding protein [Loktanella sp. S4079]KJZ19321.1 hemin ABC transporter substrate-binding protein [Loktanella sp. S4079]
MRLHIKAAAIAALALAAPTIATAQDEQRIVSIGGSITEIIYAIGKGDALIARDTTSSFPEQANDLPDVGYMRALSPEGVLSVSPGLIVSEDGAGPPETIDVLKEADIPMVMIADEFSHEGIVAKIRAVGVAVGAEQEADALANDVDAKLLTAQETAAARAGDTPKRVMFILSTQGGRIMASGSNTAADSIIAMSGAVNAITEFEGYKQLSDEAISVAAPDVILMMDRGGDHGADNSELLAMPAIVTTPAAETGSVVRMNGLYMLGFGPRTADAVLELSAALYGE